MKKALGLIAISIAMFMGTLDATIINIALPKITDYFQSSLNDTSWISTVYVLSLSVLMINASKIADQFGRKKVMIIGLVLFGGSSALCGLSSSLIFLIAMRCIQGIGGAIITPIVVPMALNMFGKEKSTLIAGLIGAITALAAAGGPPLGGLLIEYINWQSIFFINVPFSILAIILTLLYIKESYDTSASKNIDYAGMIFLTATLFLLTFSLLKGNDYGWNSAMIISMFIGSALAFVLFIITELRFRAPMMEFHLFKNLTFSASMISYLVTGFGIVVPGLIFNYFLQNVMGYEPIHAALIVTPMALTVIVSMPLGGFISNRFNARIVNFLGIFGMGLGAYFLSKLTINTKEQVMIANMVLFGFSLGFSVQSLISAIKYIPEEKSGMGSGIVNAARQIGTCLGIAVLVSMLDSHITDAKTDIQTAVYREVHYHSNLPEFMQSIIISDISQSLKDNDVNIASKIESDLAVGAMKTGTVPTPEQQADVAALLQQLNSVKNDKLVDAFTKTFFTASVFLYITSLIGLFTDQSAKKKQGGNQSV